LHIALAQHSPEKKASVIENERILQRPKALKVIGETGLDVQRK
jgi:hypothetical protein